MRLRALLVTVLLSGMAFGQGVSFQGPKIESQVPQPIAGLTISVCLATSTGTPCTPTVTVYSDPDLQPAHAISTLTTDGDGMFPTFFIAPGQYQWCASDPAQGRIQPYCTKFTAPATIGTVFPSITVSGNINGSSSTVFCLNGDTGFERNAAAWWNIGTCTPGDQSGTLSLSLLFDDQNYIASGTAAAPSRAFKNDAASGMYLVSGGVVGISGGGVSSATFSAAGVLIPGTLGVTGTSTTGPIAASGNVATSPSLGANGGALNVQKTTGGTAIYNTRVLDSFGNTNQQIIGFDVEQLINPSLNVNYLTFGQVTEVATPTTNTANFTGGDQTATYGSFSHFGSGSINSISGITGEGFNAGPATATLVKGASGTANCGGVVVNGIPNQTQTPTNNGNCTNLRAIDGVAHNFSSGIVTNAAALYAEAAANSGGGTITNAYGLFVADQTVGTNKWAIKTGAGKAEIGDVAVLDSTLQVNSTAGIGAAPATGVGILENNSALTGTTQIGIQAAPACSSAATVGCEGIRSRFDTAASAFTVATGAAIHIVEGTKGAGSAITTETGLLVEALSNGGTNFAIQVANQIKNTLATGTAPLVITSTTPVANLTTVPTAYDHTGAQITAYHLVEDSCVLGTSCGVTLAGSSVYTSSTSYTCTCQDETAIAACKVAQTAGNAFTVTGTGTDTIRYHCGGN